MSATGMKVLACGDVGGRFSAWMKRLESVHAKAGPFDMALCVGSFFAVGQMKTEDQGTWKALKEGKKRLSLPVYVLGPNSQAESSHFGDLGGYEMCENLIYLGRNGVYVTREGLKVAYLSGETEEDPQHKADVGYRFSYAHFKELQVRLRWDENDYQGVDLLLTSQWPQGTSLVSNPLLSFDARCVNPHVCVRCRVETIYVLGYI